MNGPGAYAIHMMTLKSGSRIDHLAPPPKASLGKMLPGLPDFLHRLNQFSSGRILQEVCLTLGDASQQRNRSQVTKKPSIRGSEASQDRISTSSLPTELP